MVQVATVGDLRLQLRLSPCRSIKGSMSDRCRTIKRQAVSLAFLPWYGCDQGGFYATGVRGVPGRDCQEIYQPAAAAEQRARERFGTLTPLSIAPLTKVDSSKSASENALSANRQDMSSSREVNNALPAEGREFLRHLMEEEVQKNTKELVDAAWQSLE